MSATALYRRWLWVTAGLSVAGLLLSMAVVAATVGTGIARAVSAELETMRDAGATAPVVTGDAR